jgi:hypothetical protein
MTVPRVYEAINRVMAALAEKGIAKGRINEVEGYRYRGIDDLYNALAPLLATHRLCVLPRVLERVSCDRKGLGGEVLVCVVVTVAFDLVSVEDGSTHTIEAVGEALDGGDKATSKAMTAAYKYALLQAFCIPVPDLVDADASSHRLRRSQFEPEPVQGWSSWATDIIELLKGCESPEAVDRVQKSNAALFRSIARERSELYATIGGAVAEQRARLNSDARTLVAAPKKRDAAPRGANGGRKPRRVAVHG